MATGSNFPKHRADNEIDIACREDDIQKSEGMMAYKKVIWFFEIFCPVFGTTLRYDWVPARHFLVWFTTFLIVYDILIVVYTVMFHYNNGNYSKILEPLAMVGVTSSVSN